MNNNNGTHPILYTDKITIINIYLPLLKEICYNKDIKELDELERVLLTLYSENIEKSKEFGGKIDTMEEFVNEAEEVSQDKKVKEAYSVEDEYMWLGNQKGREQEQQEIARKMLQDGLDIELISKYTNLTIEELEAMKEGK